MPSRSHCFLKSLSAESRDSLSLSLTEGIRYSPLSIYGFPYNVPIRQYRCQESPCNQGAFGSGEERSWWEQPTRLRVLQGESPCAVNCLFIFEACGGNEA